MKHLTYNAFLFIVGEKGQKLAGVILCTGDNDGPFENLIVLHDVESEKPGTIPPSLDCPDCKALLMSALVLSQPLFNFEDWL